MCCSEDRSGLFYLYLLFRVFHWALPLTPFCGCLLLSMAHQIVAWILPHVFSLSVYILIFHVGCSAWLSLQSHTQDHPYGACLHGKIVQFLPPSDCPLLLLHLVLIVLLLCGRLCALMMGMVVHPLGVRSFSGIIHISIEMVSTLSIDSQCSWLWITLLAVHRAILFGSVWHEILLVGWSSYLCIRLPHPFVGGTQKRLDV